MKWINNGKLLRVPPTTAAKTGIAFPFPSAGSPKNEVDGSQEAPVVLQKIASKTVLNSAQLVL